MHRPSAHPRPSNDRAPHWLQCIGFASLMALASCQVGPRPVAVPAGQASTSETVLALDTRMPGDETAPSTGQPGSMAELEVVDGIALAVHGGAGTLRRDAMTPELDAAYRAAIEDALLRGHRVLAAGGSAADAVEAALHPLEDSHLFNAGRGAVLTDQGTVEMDASIMLGRNGMAGAIAGARTVRHPISAARAVMERTEHVLLSGEGADRFVSEQELETMAPEWFVTPHRERQLELLREREAEKVSSLDPVRPDARERAMGPDHKFGTVGCVALDEEGHLAAGTSTGGMARKAWGRIGDSPIIGAGTWADDQTCAVSCTGWGEFFIRRAIAHQIHARMLFGGAGIGAAARQTVLEELPKGGGSGGCIALDSRGRLAAPFTTPGMYRGWVDAQGRVTVRIYGDERP